MHSRPSAIYDIGTMYGTFAAYCFDSAIVYWGSSFEAAMNAATQKAKTPEAAQRAQGRVLRQWVDMGPAGYADPGRR